MIVVAIVEAVAIVATVVTFAGVVRSLIRQHARERDLLINQLLHAAGNAWQPPPAAEKPARDESDQARVRFTASPEQLPVN